MAKHKTEPALPARKPLSRAVRYALLASAAAAGSYGVPAVAQDPIDEEIVVTGSRIVRQDYEATSPVYTLASDQIIDAGTPQLEQILNQLPQLVPSITTTSNNPSLGGQALVDVRGLGPERTLVLMEGQRLQPSTTSGIVDLNTIPTSLIESIEILSGGGSAVYGSDAIGGVVNFKMRRDFEGVELSGSSSLSGESDGRTTTATLLMGSNFADNRGNAVFILSYDKRDEVFARDREFAAVSLGPNLLPFGSTTSPDGAFVPAGGNAPSQAAYDQVFGQFGAAPGQVPATSWIRFNGDGSVFSRTPVVNFKGDTSDPAFNPANHTYNFAPVNYLQLPLVRRQMGGFGHYELAEDVELYTRLSYTTYKAAQELAPTPVSSGVGSTMRPTNPFIPADLATILASRTKCDPTQSDTNRATCTLVSGAADSFTFGRRTLEVGPRNGTEEYDVLQMTLGARGDFNLGAQPWSWDVFGSWGRTERTTLQSGNVSRSRLQSAYNATADDPNTMNVDESDPLNCGGLNPFGAGNISPECAAAIGIQAQNITVLRNSGVGASLTGGVVDLPAGPLQTAFGVEYRTSVGEFRPDEFLASGDVVGFNAQQPVDGEITVKEAFGEVSVPLLSNLPAVRYLGLDGGYRYSDYNLAGSVNTYMGGLEYRPVDEVKLRGSYQRAVRAPNIFELFRPQSEGFPQYSDPCWDGSDERTGPDAAQVNALCAAQGAPAAFPQSNPQVRALSGGNPNLQEESADTYTIGAVWQPQFGDNDLRMAIDYFQIEMDDTIGAVGASSIISRCFNDQGANPTYNPNNLWCQLFERETTGIATGVQQTDQNLGKLNVDGIDFQLDYGRPVGPGTFNTSLVATRLLSWEQQEDPASPLTSQEGTIAVVFGETFPKWKATAVLGYAWSNYDLRWQVRYIDGMDVVNSDASRSPVTVGLAPTVASYTYHRVTAGWTPTEALRVTVGIDNAFDKDPPIFTTDQAAGVQSNTEPSTYDVIGRRFFVNASYAF